MVTGKRCFDGKTKASLIASVLGGEPVPMSTLVRVTPPALERLVKRCIEKDQEDRYQSMRDVVLEPRSIAAGGTEVPVGPAATRRGGLRGGTPEVFLQTPAQERWPALSPDGRWLAYSSDESGTYQVYVRAFPDKGAKWQISNSGGIYPMWSRNGHELLFETTDSRIMLAPYTVRGYSFAADKPLLWSDRKLGAVQTVGGVAGSRNVTIAPDGKRFAALMPAAAPETEHAQNQVVFLLNFSDELRRKFGDTRR